jgi:hypothetical protein
MWGAFFRKLLKAVLVTVITVTINALGEWAAQ